MIGIIAPSRERAEDFARAQGWKPTTWIYLSTARWVYGQDLKMVLLLNDWQTAPQVSAILPYLSARGIPLFEHIGTPVWTT